MSPLIPLRAASAALFAVFAAALPTAASSALARAVPRLRQTPAEGAARSGLLQAEESETSESKKKPAFDIPFFSEDADRIAEMPPYRPDPEAKNSLPGDPICNPRCQYTCGHRECDQTCEPLCLPPKCETLCLKSADKCNTRCAKPKCAVICPTSDCINGDCPKCRTICGAPACTTSCSGSCHSVCTQPQCSWKCKAGNCPKPDCKMTCSGFSQCHDKFPDSNLTKVPLMPGMDIKSEDRASLDPKVLLKPAKAPPPEAAKPMPTSRPHQSIGYRAAEKVVATTLSPVKKLKMKWEAEDMVAENRQIFRR